MGSNQCHSSYVLDTVGLRLHLWYSMHTYHIALLTVFQHPLFPVFPSLENQAQLDRPGVENQIVGRLEPDFRMIKFEFVGDTVDLL